MKFYRVTLARRSDGGLKRIRVQAESELQVAFKMGCHYGVCWDLVNVEAL